ncbi:E3 ubiquitin-protein ligase RNF4-like [Argonauta hians]
MEMTYEIHDLDDDDIFMYATDDDSVSQDSSNTNNVDLSCYISEATPEEVETITIPDTPQSSSRVRSHRASRPQDPEQIENTAISNSPNDPILISDEPTRENNSFEDIEPSTSISKSNCVNSSVGTQTCPLCLETFDDIRRRNIRFLATSCGHIFCQKCSQLCPNLKKKCPVCRFSLKRGGLIPLFL